MISIESTTPFRIKIWMEEDADEEGGRRNEVIRRNKAAIRRIFDCFNTGDTTAIDELVHPNLLDHSPPPGTPPGPSGMKQQVNMIREQFPDVRFAVDLMIAEGDWVYARWKMIGTNTGPIYGRPPTGKRITHFGNEINRLKDGKIVEHVDSSDVLEFLDKLGLLDQEMLQQLQKMGVRSYEEEAATKSLSA